MTGRELPPTSAFAGDDGSADPGVAAALGAYAAGTAGIAAVVTALAGTRVLVPVLAELDSAETVAVGGHAHTVEKEASAGIVALQAPDGRTALPVFSSVATMTAWRADARPVPTEVARAALSAVDEGWELLVLDPGGPVTVQVPRPAVWALAQQQAWRPAVVDDGSGPRVADDVRDAVRSAVRRAVGGGPTAAERAPGGPVAPPDPGPARAEATPAAPEPSTPGARRWWRRAHPAAGHAGQAPSVAPAPTRPAAGPLVAVDAAPGARAEVAVELTLTPGLDRGGLDAVLRRVGEALAADTTVAERVDSVEVRLR